jgi:hypothetical protein
MNWDIRTDEFGATSRQDIIVSMLGEKLGEGMSRKVFRLAFRPDLVAKIEDRAQYFQNAIEWEVWKSVQGTAWEKWFAPCEDISPCGCVLIQRATTPLNGDLPPSLPNFFTDLKPGNFGRIGKQVVAHDYAINLLLSRGLTSGRVVKLPKRRWNPDK